MRPEWAVAVARITAAAPPLTQEQKTRLRILLSGVQQKPNTGRAA